MRLVVPVVFACAAAATVAACGGPQIPQHSGYKSDTAKPWTKPKTLKWSDKNEAKADGTLDYGKYLRAKWFALDLPAHGDLDIKLDINPPGDGVNEDFDLGLEIYDPGLRVIAKADAEDEGAGELNKKKSLKDLNQGRYLVHLYLQGRMDNADFSLAAAFHPTAAAEIKTDFPAQVLFPTPLAQVPLQDDAPATYHPKVETTKVTVIHGPKHTTPPPPPPPTTKPATLSARIVGVTVVSGGTQITVGRGTDTGAAQGMKVFVKGVPGGGTLDKCTARVCTAVIAATPDQIKGAGGDVTLAP